MADKAVLDQIRIIDADTHISEPADLWTSRVSVKKWGDMVPHVARNQGNAEGRRGASAMAGGDDDVWIFGGQPLWPVGLLAIAGQKGYFPSEHPPSLDQAHPAAYQAEARVQYMDEEGIYAQVLYPNVGGFGAGRFLQLKEPELMLACVRAYNDFLSEWCAVAPNRLIGVTTLPFWDVDACLEEITRCAKRGHKGILFGSHTETFDLPWLADPHWDPVWNLAQDLGQSVNYHIGSANDEARATFWPGYPRATRTARGTVTTFLDNGNAIADTIMGGICHKFPDLNFVSVESGIGWIPFVTELLDWNYTNMGAFKEHPEWDLLPSEFFKRQFYGCFWFEGQSVLRVVEDFADNILYETDFPHPVSMSPGGPPGVGGHPRDYVEQTLGHLPEEILRKVLFENSARVYHVD